MENDILDSLNDLGYEGPLSDEAAFSKALEGGPKSLEYTKLVHILADELKNLCNLEESVSMMNDPDDSSSFLLELSSFLKELGCPYKKLVTGHMSSRLQSKEDRLLLLDYLVSELMSARMVNVDRPKDKQAGMEIVVRESPTAKDLKEILISLKFNKPPPNITPEMLFSKLEAKLKDTIQKEGEQLVGKPLYNKALTEKDWKQLETTFNDMFEDYRLRRETLITRLECTIQSFEWSDRLKAKKDAIQTTYRPKRELLKVKPDVKLSDFLAARTSLLLVEKTSSASVRKNTQSDVTKVIIGQVPDRGGRPNEQQPPPPEMPSWQQRAPQVVKRKLTPSDMRRKEKRLAKRAAIFAQAGEGRTQPPAERQEVAKESVMAPITQVSAKLSTSPGCNQGGTKQRAEKVALHSQGAEEVSKAPPKPKRKRGGRGKGKAMSNKNEGQSKVSKRPRSDTQSPLNRDAKRIKTSSIGVVRDVVTTDTVVLNDLFVVVMAEPFTALTPEQVEDIKDTLGTCIENIANTPGTATNVPYWPTFRGKPFHSEGVLKLQCEDTKDVEWLRKIVATFKSPIPGTRLVVKRQNDIFRKVKSGVLLPACSDEVGLIYRLLIGQNRWYQVNEWSLYNIQRQGGDPPGTFLVLGIPADQIPGILARGRRLCYKLGNAYIRFFGSTGKLQDMPPDSTQGH